MITGLFFYLSIVFIGNEFLECEDTVKLLGVKLDNDLMLNEHAFTLLKMDNKNMHAFVYI